MYSESIRELVMDVRCCKPSTRTCIFLEKPNINKTKFIETKFIQKKTAKCSFYKQNNLFIKINNFFIYAFKINFHEFVWCSKKLQILMESKYCHILPIHQTLRPVIITFSGPWRTFCAAGILRTWRTSKTGAESFSPRSQPSGITGRKMATDYKS